MRCAMSQAQASIAEHAFLIIKGFGINGEYLKKGFYHSSSEAESEDVKIPSGRIGVQKFERLVYTKGILDFSLCYFSQSSRIIEEHIRHMPLMILSSEHCVLTVALLKI